MQGSRLVANFFHAVFVFIGISLSSVLLVGSTGGNATALEKVNFNISYYPLSYYLKQISEFEGVIQFNPSSELICRFEFQCTIGCQCNLAASNITIICPNGSSIVEVEYPPVFVSSSDLPEEDIDEESIWTPGFDFSFSISFSYPDSWLELIQKALLPSSLPSWLYVPYSQWVLSSLGSEEDRYEESIETRQSESFEIRVGNVSSADSLDSYGSSPKYMPITIYSWNNTGLNSITRGAFKHLSNINECYLILSRNNITDIQLEFKGLSKLHGLFLENNKIASIHLKAFTGLESLVYLYLHHNNITDILPYQFQDLINLWELYIGHNSISVIGQTDFKGLDNLRFLNLEYNNIVEIQSGSFHELTKLKVLDVNHNNISDIPSHLFSKLRRLTTLNLANNIIVSVHPQAFQNLNNMVTLIISHNEISTIHPHQFQNLTELFTLSLDHNRISDIHSQQFQTLTNLYKLHLGHNEINEISSHVFSNVNMLRLVELNISYNKISQIHPQQFQNLPPLESLYLSHNGIFKIHPMQFENLPKLYELYLDHNMISTIHPLQFRNLRRLQRLHLHHNNIGAIYPYQFQDLSQVCFEILLDHNNLTEIPSHLFRKNGTVDRFNLGHNRISIINPQTRDLNSFIQGMDLSDLRLAQNRISDIHPLLLQNFTKLRVLFLDNNDITDLNPNQFQPVQHELRYLDLSHNNLVKFTLASTVEFSRLTYLSLANNKLRALSYTIFQSMLSLELLNASSNHIDMINPMILFNNSTAKVTVTNVTRSVAGNRVYGIMIDLRQNNLYSLNTESFSHFSKLTVVMVDYEATCCFLTTVNCSYTIPRSQFLTCGRLLPNQIQRVTMWMLGLFALFSNLGALFYKYRNKEKENKVQLLLISNLSISDMIMGVYMIIISSADLYYKTTFPSEKWRVSFACKFAGTLSILSSEASVFFVTLISVDRLIGIKCPFSIYRFGTRTSRILSLVVWLFSISISILSTILSGINPDWYDVSEVCTGLPLSKKYVFKESVRELTLGPKDQDTAKTFLVTTTDKVVTSYLPGMYYGIAIFTALNSICFVVVCVCYTGIFVSTIQTAKQAGRARDTKQERKMAIKMGAIVITDLACWAPIIILSILVQSGRHVVTPRVYTWIVTFVLPINSAINPFLYTLAALIFDFVNKKTKS